MKFVVTGATSGLGRNAVEWLLQMGYDVHATGRDRLVGEQLVALGARFTPLNLITASELEYQNLLSDCDVVWHCAALSSPWGKYQDFYQANVLVTTRLANWAGKIGIKRFVHVSTPSICFDFKSQLNIKEDYLAKRFANHYAATKYQAEQVIQQQCDEFPATTYVILRPRGLFGPHDRVIIPRVLAQIKRTNGTLYLPSGGNALVDLTFVLNVVYALFLASTNASLKSGEVFNITNQQPAKLADLLVQLLNEKLQLNCQIKALPYRLLYGVASILELSAKVSQKEPLLTRYSIGAVHFDMTLDQQAAIERLGYQAKYSLQQGIEITANWLLNNQGLPRG